MDSELRSKASKQFNTLPFEQRVNAKPIIISTQLAQLWHERERVKSNYHRTMKGIRDHEKSLERILAEALEKKTVGEEVGDE